jgi:hypothetical protein
MMFNLFQGCPTFGRWWDGLNDRGRILTCIGITWFPLLVLSMLEGNSSFLQDVAMSSRFLISLPCMLLIPRFTGMKLKVVLDQFIIGKIVRGEEAVKFNGLVSKGHSIKQSRLLNWILWVIVYCIAFSAYYFYETVRVDSWRAVGNQLTYAGWWLNFISHPIYVYTFFSFLWRSGVWWWLMYKVSKLELYLRPTHGDDLGGIGFLSGTVRAFALPAWAFSISFAAGAANLVLYEDVTLDALKIFLVCLAIVLSGLFIGPLFFFFRPLIVAKREFVLKYNTLASKQIDAFERKWLLESKLERNYIGDPDFSALIDLNDTVNRVSSMKTVPFRIQDIYFFIICVVLPFLPVIALTLSWKELANMLLRLMHL